MMIFRPQGILPARGASASWPSAAATRPPVSALFEAREVTKRFGGLTGR